MNIHSNRCGSSKAFPLNESFCESSAAEGYEISVNRKDKYTCLVIRS